MDRTEVTTVGQLAKIAHQNFELRQREGTHLYYQALKDGSPQWVCVMPIAQWVAYVEGLKS